MECWFWALVAFLIGALFGVILCAILSAIGEDDDEYR